MPVETMGRIRWTVAAEFVSPESTGHRVHATAKQTGLFVRLDTRRLVPMPDTQHAALA